MIFKVSISLKNSFSFIEGMTILFYTNEKGSCLPMEVKNTQNIKWKITVS